MSEDKKVDARMADSPKPIDAMIDTPVAARCNPTAPFGTPIALDELNSAAYEDGGSLSPDELAIYFSSARAGGIGSTDVYIATRASRDAAFGAPSLVAGVNTTGGESYPSVTGDGLHIYLTTGTTDYDIQAAQRASTTNNFGSHSPVTSLNGTSVEGNQYILANHSAIYFESIRGGTDSDLYRAARNAGGTFDSAIEITSVSTANDEKTPVLSTDELTLFFASNRTGGSGLMDIWLAKRTTTGDGFGAPTAVTELNTSVNELPTWVSPDGCVLYLLRDVSGRSSDLFVAKRGM